MLIWWVSKKQQEFGEFMKDLGYPDLHLPPLDDSKLWELGDKIEQQCGDDENCKKQKFIELVKKIRWFDTLPSEQKNELIMQLFALWLELGAALEEVKQELEKLKDAIGNQSSTQGERTPESTQGEKNPELEPDEPLTKEADFLNPFFDKSALEKLNNNEISPQEVLMYAVDVVLSKPEYQQAFVKMVQNPELVKACKGEIDCVLENALLAGFANKDGTPTNNYLALQQALNTIPFKEREEILENLYESAVIAEAVDDIMKSYMDSIVKKDDMTKDEAQTWEEVLNQEGIVGAIKKAYETMKTGIKGMLEMLNMKDKKAENWSNIITLWWVVLGGWMAFKKAVSPTLQKWWKKFNKLPLRWKILGGVGLWFGKDVAEANWITVEWIREFLFGKAASEELEIQEGNNESKLFYLDAVVAAILPADESLESLEREGIIVYDKNKKRYEFDWEKIKDHPLIKTVIKSKYNGDEGRFRNDLTLSLNSIIQVVPQDNNLSKKAKIKDIVAQKWRMVWDLKKMITPEDWNRLKEEWKYTKVMSVILRFEMGDITFEEAKTEIQKLLNESSWFIWLSDDPDLPPNSPSYGGAFVGGAASVASMPRSSWWGGPEQKPAGGGGSWNNPPESTYEASSEADWKKKWLEELNHSFDKIRQLIEDEVSSCFCPESQKEEVRVDAYALAYFIFMNNPSADPKYVEQQIKDYIRQQSVKETVDVLVGNPEPYSDIFEFIKTEIDKLDNEEAEKLAKKMVVLSWAQSLLNILLHHCDDSCQEIRSEIAQQILETNLNAEKFFYQNIENASEEKRIENILNAYVGLFNWAITELAGNLSEQNELYEFFKNKNLNDLFGCEETTSFEDCKKSVDKTIAEVLVRLWSTDLAVSRLGQYFGPPENLDEEQLNTHKKSTEKLLIIWAYSTSWFKTKYDVLTSEGVLDCKKTSEGAYDYDECDKKLLWTLHSEASNAKKFYGDFTFFGKKISDILDADIQDRIVENAYLKFSKVIKDPDVLSTYGIDGDKLKWQKTYRLDWSEIDEQTREKLVNLFDAYLASEFLIESIKKISKSEEMLDTIDKQYPWAKEVIKLVAKESKTDWRKITKFVLIALVGSMVLPMLFWAIGVWVAGAAASALRLWVRWARWARMIWGWTLFSVGLWWGEEMVERWAFSPSVFVWGVMENKNAKDFLLNIGFFGISEVSWFISSWKAVAGKPLMQRAVVGGITAFGYGTIETLFDKEFTFSNFAEAITMWLLMAFLHWRPVKVERRGGKYAVVGIENAIKDSRMEVNISPRIRVEVSNGKIRVVSVDQPSSLQSFKGQKFMRTKGGIIVPYKGDIIVSRNEFLNESDLRARFGQLNLTDDEIKALELIQQQLKVLEGYNFRLATGGITGGAKEMIWLEFNRWRQTIKNTLNYRLMRMPKWKPLIVKDNGGAEVGRILREGSDIIVELPNQGSYSFDEMLRLRAQGRGNQEINRFFEVLERGWWRVAVPANLVKIDRSLKNPKAWDKILWNQDFVERELSNNYNIQVFRDGKKIKVTVKQGNRVIVDDRPINSNREEQLLSHDPSLPGIVKSWLRERMFLNSDFGKELLKNKLLAFQVGDQQFARLRFIKKWWNKVSYRIETKRGGRRVEPKEFNSLEEAFEELERSGVLVSYTEALLKRVGLWTEVKAKLGTEGFIESVKKYWRTGLDGAGWILVGVEGFNDFKDGVDTADIMQIGLGGLWMWVISKIPSLNKLESFVFSYYLAKIGLEWLGPAKEYPMEDNG